MVCQLKEDGRILMCQCNRKNGAGVQLFVREQEKCWFFFLLISLSIFQNLCLFLSFPGGRLKQNHIFFCHPSCCEAAGEDDERSRKSFSNLKICRAAAVNEPWAPKVVYWTALTSPNFPTLHWRQLYAALAASSTSASAAVPFPRMAEPRRMAAAQLPVFAGNCASSK